MSKVLFLNQPSMGHLNTLLTIALQMKEDGHEVSFLVPGIKNNNSNIEVFRIASLVPQLIEKNNIKVDLVTPSLLAGILGLALPFASGYNELMLALEVGGTGIEHYAREVIKHLEVNKFDVLVSDFAFFAAHIAAEYKNIPCATVFHSGLPFKGKNIPPFGSALPIGDQAEILGQKYLRRERFIFSRLNGRINRAKRKFGLPPISADTLSKPYSKWLNLVTSAEAIEAERDSLTDNTFFIGPCFAKRKNQTTDFPFDKLRSDKYKVYVSLGTVFNNKPKVFQKIMNALNHPDYQVIISGGGAYEKLKQGFVPENVLLFPSVPQIDLLPKVDLVIGHGGNNTTNETLAAGKPLIIMPIGGEQGDNASRVEYLKVGLRIDIYNFNENELRVKVDLIRTKEEFAQRATELKTELAKTDGAKSGAVLVELLAKIKKPLLRPKGFPLTVTNENRLQFLT